MSIQITTSELLDAIAEATNVGPADARTAQELMQEFHLSREKVMEALHQFQREGRLSVHVVARRSIDGHFRKVPGYVVAPKSDQREKRSRMGRPQ
jgi:diadenosine tetraphosphate (Ap4A) HIT family hydrolase